LQTVATQVQPAWLWQVDMVVRLAQVSAVPVQSVAEDSQVQVQFVQVDEEVIPEQVLPPPSQSQWPASQWQWHPQDPQLPASR